MRWGSSPGRGALARCTPLASRRRWKGCGTRAPVSPCRALASPIPDDLRLFSPQSRSLSIRPSLPIPYRTAWGIASAGFMVYTGSAFPPSWSAPKQAARRRSTSRSRRLIESSQWSILPTAQSSGAIPRPRYPSDFVRGKCCGPIERALGHGLRGKPPAARWPNTRLSPVGQERRDGRENRVREDAGRRGIHLPGR